MTEYIYNKFKEECLEQVGGGVSGNTYKAVLVDLGSSNANVPAVDAADPQYSDLSAANLGGDTGTPIVATLSSVTMTAGVFDCSDTTTFTAVIAGGGSASSADGIAIYDDDHADDRLMCIIDLPSTLTFVGSPGANVVIDWDDTTSMNAETGGIFAL